jgi:hypothetical protein
MFVNSDVHKKGKGLIFLALAKSFWLYLQILLKGLWDLLLVFVGFYRFLWGPMCLYLKEGAS